MFPYKIHFTDSPVSPAVQSQIEAHLAKIGQLHERINSCEVTVRIPHKHHAKRFFHIHILLKVPGDQIVVSREHEDDEAHMKIETAVHDAFNKLSRQLNDFVKKRAATH